MSRVLKSSQIILDKDKFKLPSTVPSPKKSNTKAANGLTDERSIECNNEAIIEKKIKEIDELYETTVEKARNESDKIIAEAYEKSKEIMEKAREEGFLEGKSEGFKEGKDDADSIIQEALSVKREVEDQRKTLIDDLEKELIGLSISTIEKILNKKIEEDHDIIENLVHMGLEKCGYTDELVLRVSPDDYDFAYNSKDKILALSQNVSDIMIKGDVSLSKGSCIIDSPLGSVDTGIWPQFEKVKSMFEELLKSE